MIAHCYWLPSRLDCAHPNCSACDAKISSLDRHPTCIAREKDRKLRNTPLRKDTVAVLRGWLAERQGQPSDPAFPTITGVRLSHDGFQGLLKKHVALASRDCRSLAGKRVTPHVLRHTLAMDLLHHGVDCSVIALWLGHESIETTAVYLHADMKLKEQALAKTSPSDMQVKRFRPDDELLAFLKSL